MNDRLTELYTELIREMNDKKTGHFSASAGLLSVILTLIVRMVHAQNEYKPENQNNLKTSYCYIYIERAEKYIIDNYTGKISVDDICSHLAVSKSYLFYLFSNYLNITPGKYVTMLRMKKAEQLLKNSNKSIKEISEYIGYDDQLYFSRIFKKIYGVSPTQFLKYYNF